MVELVSLQSLATFWEMAVLLAPVSQSASNFNEPVGDVTVEAVATGTCCTATSEIKRVIVKAPLLIIIIEVASRVML